MKYPLTYELQNGTRVEVAPNKTGNRFVFDLFHNNIMCDSFTWAPVVGGRKIDAGISDSKSLESRYTEAIHKFIAMQEAVT